MHVMLRLAVAFCVLYPGGFNSSPQSEPEAVRRARDVLAAALDPALPAIPFDAWIRQVVGAAARYQWASGACAGAKGAFDAPVPVCAVVVASSRTASVTISLRVGDFIEESSTRSWEGRHRWGTPRFDTAYIEKGGEALALGRLGELSRLLTIPTSEWPSADVSLAEEPVSCVPAEPMPGEGVECAVVVTNVSDAFAHARVFMDLPPDGDAEAAGIVALPARERRTVRVRFPWPLEEGARVRVSVEVLRQTPYLVAGAHGERLLAVRSERDALANLRQPADGGELQTILAASGTMAGNPRALEVPVDSSVSRLLVSVALEGGTAAVLVRPGGTAVAPSDADVTRGTVRQIEVGRQSVETLQVFSVAAPEPGVWRLELSPAERAGAGPFAVQARGNSPVGLGSFGFYEQSLLGRDQPIAGMPLAGRSVTGMAWIWEPPSDAAFRAVDEAGAALQTLEFEPPYIVGPITLPTVPFSIVMEATDVSGAPIRRQYPIVFRAQTVSVGVDYSGGQGAEPVTIDATAAPAEQMRTLMALAGFRRDIAPASSRQIRFVVTNHGSEAATFALDVRTSVGSVRGPSPATVTIEPGAVVVATFVLTIPASVSAGESVELRMTARNAADPALRNSATLVLEVAEPVAAERGAPTMRPRWARRPS